MDAEQRSSAATPAATIGGSVAAPALEQILRDTAAADEKSRDDFLARFLATDDWTAALAMWLRRCPPAGPLTPATLRAWLNRSIALIDETLTEQVNEILHHPDFQQLESSWRGIRYLVERAATDPARTVRVRVLDAKWRELARDAERAPEPDQTALFQKVYEEEFGLAGGEPFSVLVGDYAIHPRPGPDHPIDDLDLLQSISQTASAAFAPFLCGAHPSLLGLEDFGQLERQIDLERIFQGADYAKWHALRRNDDSRFLGVLLPRVLLRRPYGPTEAIATWRSCVSCGTDLGSVPRGSCPRCNTWFDRDDSATYNRRRLGFRFAEDVEGPDNRKYLWGNAAFAFAGVLIRAFIDCGWLADIRGFDRNIEQGGIVTGLPVHEFDTDSPGVAPKMSTDVVVDDFQEKSIADSGLIPLSHCHDTEFCVFYSNRSVHKPEVYSDERTTLNARISSMLQYTLCISRVAHYLKVQSRDLLGGALQTIEIERRLRDWVNEYVTADDLASPSVKARYPLREAEVQVREVPGRPGVHQLIMKLWPHYQLDDLLISVRMVSRLDGGRLR